MRFSLHHNNLVSRVFENNKQHLFNSRWDRPARVAQRLVRRRHPQPRPRQEVWRKLQHVRQQVWISVWWRHTNILIFHLSLCSWVNFQLVNEERLLMQISCCSNNQFLFHQTFLCINCTSWPTQYFWYFLMKRLAHFLYF